MSDLEEDLGNLLFDEDFFCLDHGRVYKQTYKSLFPLIVKQIRLVEEKAEEEGAGNEFDEEYGEENVQICPILKVEIIFTNDKMYVGESQRGRLEGNGLFKWPDETFYRGTFENNRMTGRGVIKYPHNLRTFEGELYVSQRHGFGAILTETFTYTGNFTCGYLNGTGSLKSKNESFDGKFINNIFHDGVRCGDFGTFNGTFNKIGEKKFGILSLKTGDLYKGYWSKGNYHKFGIYEWGFIDIDAEFIKVIPNRYIGFWKKNMRHGVGMLEFDERKLICYWEYDCKQGPGIIIAANGDIFVNDKMFKNDELKNVRKIIKTKEICCKFTDFLRIFDNPEKYLDNPDTFPLDRDTFSEKVASFMRYSSELDPTIMPLFLPNYVNDISEMPAIHFAEKNLPAIDSDLLKQKEITSFTQTIISNYDDLLKLYKHYGNFGLAYKYENIAITRLGLWQFYRDVISTSVSINILQHIEECDNTYHTLVIDRYNPSELIYFWQFLRHLIHLIITLNNLVMENNCLKERPSYFGLIGTTMLIFLREKEEMEYFKFKMLKSLMEKHPKAFGALLAKIKTFELIPVTIRTIYRFVKKLSQEYVKDECPSLDHIYPTDFIECSQKIFPYMVDGKTLMETLFPVTILEFMEIILLLFARNIENKRREYFYNIYLQKLEEEEERLATLNASTKKDKKKGKK